MSCRSPVWQSITSAICSPYFLIKLFGDHALWLLAIMAFRTCIGFPCFQYCWKTSSVIKVPSISRYPFFEYLSIRASVVLMLHWSGSSFLVLPSSSSSLQSAVDVLLCSLSFSCFIGMLSLLSMVVSRAAASWSVLVLVVLVLVLVDSNSSISISHCSRMLSMMSLFNFSMGTMWLLSWSRWYVHLEDLPFHSCWL